MKRSVVWWFWAAVVAWPTIAKAEWPRFRLGAELEARSDAERVVLSDGRLLECADGACETLDPTTGLRVPVAGDPGSSLEAAVALDDGTLLLASGRLFDPSTGAVIELPASGHALSGLRGVALSGGRAAFWFPEASGHCRSLLLFHGRRHGFREFEAAQGRACITAVHDLGEERLLVTTSLPAALAASVVPDLSFAVHDVRTGRWQTGPRLSQRYLLAAFGYAGGALIFVARYDLLRQAQNRVEAVFLTRDGQRRTLTFERPRMDRSVARFGEHEFVLFDANTAYLWDARGKSAVRPRAIPAPPLNRPRTARRGKELVLFDASRSGYALVLSRNGATPEHACSLAFDYARSVLATRAPQLFSPSQLDALMPEDGTCYEWLDRQGRFPEPFQSALGSLLARSEGTPPPSELVAAELLCTLQPAFGAGAIEQLERSGALRASSADLRCQNAAGSAKVLSAARSSGDVGAVLLSTGLARDGSQRRVEAWVVPLLRFRRELRRHAAPLLHAARLHHADGEEALYRVLCVDDATPDVRCTEGPPSPSDDWQSRRTNRALKRLGIVSGVVGGIGALAYVGREDDLGRGIAVGTGFAAGASLGFIVTLSTGKGGDTAGLGALLLAFPVSLVTGVAGAVIAAKTSKEPGDARFATAAVPLAVFELAAVISAIDDL